MPYCKSNRNLNSNTPPQTKVSTFGNQDPTNTKDYYHHQGLSPQNYRYLSFLPVIPITNGVNNATKFNQIAAKDQNIPQLRSPLQQVPEEEGNDDEEQGNQISPTQSNQYQQQNQFLHGLQIHHSEYHATSNHPEKFDIFNCNDAHNNNNNNNVKAPRNLPCDTELVFARANSHLNNSSSILQQLQILPTETIDVYDYLNPRKAANMGYREKIRSWLTSVPLAIAYDENSTQFNLNCYPGVVSISETATNSDVEIDLADIDDVLELQAQRVTRYVNKLYFNEQEVPLPIEESGQDLEEDDFDDLEEQEDEGEAAVAEHGLEKEADMDGINDYSTKNPTLPQRNHLKDKVDNNIQQHQDNVYKRGITTALETTYTRRRDTSFT